MRTTERLYGVDEPGPAVTQLCVRWGLWPLVIPILWAIVALAREQQDSSTWELLAWLTIAILFCIFIGGSGIMATIAPFSCV